MRNSICLFIFVVLFNWHAIAAERICSPKSDRAALIVIDMQPYFATRAGVHTESKNAEKIEKILAKQVQAIQKAKQSGLPIVFIEYEMPNNDETSSRLKEAVKGYKDVKVIKKDSDGMFDEGNIARQPLIEHLKKNDIGTLIITGANGGACVEASIRGSLVGDCNVVAYSDGIADFNYRDFIYPYVGQYNEIKPQCPDCTFREVHGILDVVETMHGIGGQNTEASAVPKSTEGVR